MAPFEELSSLRDYARRYGWRRAAERSLAVLRERLLPPWERLYWIPAAEVAPIPAPPDARLRVARRPEELGHPQWCELSAQVGPRACELYRERVSRGCELHLLELDGRIAGSQFFIPGTLQPFQHVVLTERDALLMDVRIHREFRGRGLAPLFYSLSVQDLARRGCERVFGAASVHNTPSLRTFERVGFRHLVDYRFRRGRYHFDRELIE